MRLVIRISLSIRSSRRRLRNILPNRFLLSILRTPHFTKRTTKDSRPPSTRSCRSGARPPGAPINRMQKRTARRSVPTLFMWEVMFWPIVACVLLPWLLVYLGLHVVQRGIIFIDIAMAQMASLGICLAVLLRFEPESLMAFTIGLAVTLIGAAIFSATGKR